VSGGALLAALLIDRARAAHVTIATAESCTGGLVSAALTEVAGASDVFLCGFVTYSNAAKTAVLSVPATVIATHGAVSEQVAGAMADGALARSGATLAISVTGVAGPGASGRKPEGRVCFGLARAGAATRVETVEFGALGRAGVRGATVAHALALLDGALTDSALPST